MCNIVVSSAEKSASSIVIQGTATCKEVFVRLNVPNTLPLTAPVDANGNWEVAFTTNEVPDLNNFPCPAHVKVEIHCVEDENCKGPAEIFILCAGTSCPSITVREVSISGCNAAGQRTVTLEIDVSNAPQPTILEIDYGDGDDDTIQNSEIVASAGNPITKQHTYPSGNYAVTVNIIFPEGCARSNTLTVDVPPCDIPCPDDIDLEIIDAAGNRFAIIDPITGVYQQINNNPNDNQIDCFPSGDYTVRLIEPSTSLQSITWREDEDPPVMTNNPDQEVSLNGGEWKIMTVTVIKENCAPLSESVVIKACGCSETEWSEWSDCVDCVQTRTRTLSDCSEETETRPCTSTPTDWSPWSTSGFNCTQMRTRRNENCQVEVESRIDWCCVWMWIAIGLIALTGVVILVALCMLPATFWSAVAALGSGGTLTAVWATLSTVNIVLVIAAIALFVISLVVFILWLIFCIFRNARDAACALLEMCIAVMAWVTSISAIIALILTGLTILCGLNIFCLFQTLGCAVGAWIDVAWFGIILSVALIIHSFLCRRR